ncbi:MAG: hypothetical protein RR956_04700 [Christensenella sp.]
MMNFSKIKADFLYLSLPIGFAVIAETLEPKNSVKAGKCNE